MKENKMPKCTVEEIEEMAEKTLKQVKGRRNKVKVKRPLVYVEDWRFYCERVLFLCKEIKKRDKTIERLRKSG